MTLETNNTLTLEGKSDRLQSLFLSYQSIRHKKRTEEIAGLAIDMGREFLALKSETPAGFFLKSLELNNIPISTAEYYISFYKKFGKYRDIVQKLGKSKVYVLNILNDEEVKSIMEGNAVYGLTLPDISSLSFKQFRAMLPKLRKTIFYTGPRKRLSLFTMYIKLAFSALTGGVK